MAKPSREYIFGINPAVEVIRAGKRRIYEAFLNEAACRQPRIQEVAGLLEQAGVPIHWVARERTLELSGNKEHQGVVLKTGVYPYCASSELWDRPRLVVLDGVEDPYNVGAILRSAEIFGFSGVLLANKGVPDIYPTIVKVAVGATEYLDIAKDAPALDYVQTARERGYQVVALDGLGRIDMRDVQSRLTGKVLVVIGGEDTGVDPAILAQADLVASIRQQGRINSLNAAVAAGISLFSLAAE